MSPEVVIRCEPGAYSFVARYGNDGSFTVHGESVEPITLTLRVEDVWSRLPAAVRRYRYRAEVRTDGAATPVVLPDVAPDARIFLEFKETFDASFT